MLLQLAFQGAGSGLNISDPPGAALLDYDLSQPGALSPLVLGQPVSEVLRVARVVLGPELGRGVRRPDRLVEVQGVDNSVAAAVRPGFRFPVDLFRAWHGQPGRGVRCRRRLPRIRAAGHHWPPLPIRCEWSSTPA